MHSLRSTVDVPGHVLVEPWLARNATATGLQGPTLLPITQNIVPVEGCVVVLPQPSRLTVVVTANKGWCLLQASGTTGTNEGVWL